MPPPPPAPIPTEPLAGPRPPAIPPGAVVAVAAFSAICLGFQLFTEARWVPILDSFNLMMHEAGHPLIRIFGSRAEVYGGTVFQIIFPLATAIHFRRSGQLASLATSLVWLGENLINIARYMADARAQLLPLVGGGEHDWAEIFFRWNVLPFDTRIAAFTRGFGVILILATVAWLIRVSKARADHALTDRA